MIKLNSLYNLDTIRDEIEQISLEHGWWDQSQISLQSAEKDVKNFHTGIGRLEWSDRKETDFVHLNIPENFELARFIKDNKLHRTRIMKMAPKSCYSYHRDSSSRIHLAVDTHDNCFFIEDRKLIHIPADGFAYKVDTTQFHSAVNLTRHVYRTHIVGCT